VHRRDRDGLCQRRPGLKYPTSNAAGVLAGKPPITFKIGSAPLGTFWLASTSPSASMTATWDRLRCTSIPT